MRNYLVFLAFLLVVGKALATTFIPVSIKKQIVESDGIVKGEVVTTSSFEDESGKILTRVFLRADKWIGVKPEESHLEVFYPGGKIGDKVQLVYGAPKFKTGEKVVLFLKEGQDHLWVQNLALGKFMIKKYGSVDILINSVFPNHPEAGQIPLTNFYELTKVIKKKDFRERFKDKYEIEAEKAVYNRGDKKSRAIASLQHKREDNLSVGWLLALLGIMGGVFSFLRRKQDYQ